MIMDRVYGLGPQDFVDTYVRHNRPVVVADAMARWPALRRWTPAGFGARFGEWPVQVYDDLFCLLSTRPLKHYISRHVDGLADARPGVDSRVPYVRWFSRQNAQGRLPWSDDVFAQLAPEWSCPDFFPQHQLLWPSAGPGVAQNPVHDPFPARAIFLSARGARTRLHIDPWASDAILCQVAGRKRFVLFEPQASQALRDGGQLVDLRYDLASDRWRSPVAPWCDDCLAPGETIMIPAGWPHAFHTVDASISLTWNYLHQVNLSRLEAYQPADVAAGEAETWAYFLRSGIGTPRPATTLATRRAMGS